MSNESIREAAEREAEPDEPAPTTYEPAPEPDDEGEGEQDTEPESTLPAPLEQSMEKQIKTMGRETDRHEKRVREIMGEDAELLEPCPLCQVPGFVFPYTDDDPSAEPRRMAVMEYFGGAEPPYVEAPDKETCPTCEGWGEYLSGSKNFAHRVEMCSRCGGNGYIAKVEPMPQTTYQPVPGEVPSGHSVGVNGGQPNDVWDRPFGHPHYGVPPTLVTG